jgi:8-oxo-dGTP diphosphatase
MNRRIAVRGIVLQDNKLLCVRLKPSAIAPQNGSFWCVPGGGLESEEGLLQGLEREFIEETGVRPQIGDLLYVQQYKDDKSEYLEFFFAVTNHEDYQQIDLAKTTHGMQELEEIGFIDPHAVKVLPVFLAERMLTDDTQEGRAHYFSYL